MSTGDWLRKTEPVESCEQFGEGHRRGCSIPEDRCDAARFERWLIFESFEPVQLDSVEEVVVFDLLRPLCTQSLFGLAVQKLREDVSCGCGGVKPEGKEAPK